MLPFPDYIDCWYKRPALSGAENITKLVWKGGANE